MEKAQALVTEGNRKLEESYSEEFNKAKDALVELLGGFRLCQCQLRTNIVCLRLSACVSLCASLCLCLFVSVSLSLSLSLSVPALHAAHITEQI